MADRIFPDMIARLAAGTPRPSFLFDYDGTLTPIAGSPELAVLSPEMKNALHMLNSAGAAKTAVISGRTLEDMKSLLQGAGEMTLTGNHGFESDGPDFPDKDSYDEQISDFDSRLRGLEESFPGCRIENKKSSLALHYRNAPPARVPDILREFFGIWSMAGDNRRFQIMAGKKVFEIRPRGMNKGIAALRILENWHGRQWHAGARAFFFGDDTTDEDAFRALNRFPQQSAVTVFVGNGRVTCARFRLESVDEVRECIELSAHALRARRRESSPNTTNASEACHETTG